jgi:streptogramin lyase
MEMNYSLIENAPEIVKHCHNNFYPTSKSNYYRMNRYTFLLVFILFFSPFSYLMAQGVGIGEWKEHLPYNNCIALADAGDFLYCATPYSLFSLRKSDKSTERINKITGLSDVGISAIGYSTEYKTLLIAYTNTNIDLIKNGVIINISDIKRKSILGSKTINKVLFIGKYAYLSCGFGIVVVDVDREEIYDTYIIGPDGDQLSVFDLTLNPVDSEFYAATESGIYRANASDNLAYYISWRQDTTLPSPDGKYNLISAFAGRVYVNNTPKEDNTYDKDTMLVYANGVWNYYQVDENSNKFSFKVSEGKLVICASLYAAGIDEQENNSFWVWTYNPGVPQPNDAFVDSENNIWIADKESGLVRNYNTWSNEMIVLDGPVSSKVYAMDARGTDLWAVPGGRDGAFDNIYNVGAFYSYTDGKWNSYTKTNEPFLDTIRDVLAVAVDPRNPKHVFLGTWGFRLIEYLNGKLDSIYDASNSSLQYSMKQPDRLIIGGLMYDQDNNLWIVNSSASNLVSVLRNNNTWKSFDLGATASGVDAGAIAIDKSGQKWILQRDHTILVFKDNNTIDNTGDDQVKRLTGNVGNGALPGQFVQCMAVDQEGAMWIGTDEGIAVFYNPENVFTNSNYDAQRIVVKTGNDYGNLLETESITVIEVNGDNQKWIGTDRAGVFLMSPDGQEQIYHFTEENSPLLSNTITSIAMDEKGNVYFGTAKGIISYKDFAIPPKEVNDSVYVYPNPVRETYDGPIAITNLVKDSDVKITDINGVLVYKAIAKGGQAIWDGRNFAGRRANTGVYLVFITNIDGSQTLVSKILFIN